MSFAHVGRLFSLSQQATLKRCMQPCTVSVPDLLSLQPPTSAPTPPLEPPELSMGSVPSLCPGCWLRRGRCSRFWGIFIHSELFRSVIRVSSLGKVSGREDAQPSTKQGLCLGREVLWGAASPELLRSAGEAISGGICASPRVCAFWSAICWHPAHRGAPKAAPEPLCGELQTSLHPKTGLNGESRQPTCPPRLSIGAALAHPLVRGSLVWGSAVTILHPSALKLQGSSEHTNPI